jgi:hypothetical protein
LAKSARSIDFQIDRLLESPRVLFVSYKNPIYPPRQTPNPAPENMRTVVGALPIFSPCLSNRVAWLKDLINLNCADQMTRAISPSRYA